MEVGVCQRTRGRRQPGKRTASALFVFFALAASASPPDEPHKLAVFVTGIDDATPVAQSLAKKLNESKPFEAATKKDPSQVVVLISCMVRKQEEPFVCMYVSHYNGATFKTFLGGGLFFSASADAVADNFLASIAQDIVERLDSANRDNLKEALEGCLLLTDSKCNVPDLLQKELGAKQLTLGQYLLKQHP